MTLPRTLLPTVLAIVAVSLAACGGGDDGGGKPTAAPGTPENPLVAEATTLEGEDGAPARRVGEPTAPSADGAQGEPGYDALVKQQSSDPQNRFTPCNLVTDREARAIVGEPIEEPFEAPQGPTCIYRTRTGKQMIALAVQTTSFSKLKPRIRGVREIAVGDRAGYCGHYGQPVLYVPLSEDRVLSVSARCDVAQGFARKALSQL